MNTVVPIVSIAGTGSGEPLVIAGEDHAELSKVNPLVLDSPKDASIAPATGCLFRVKLAADLNAVRGASASARRFLEAHQVDAEIVAACELALVEACNNAILYTPAEQSQSAVEICLICQRDAIELQVIDHTPGFDWPEHLELPEPDSEHGRGLFIIQSLMDETLYLRSGSQNRLIMTKRRGIGAGQPRLISTIDSIEPPALLTPACVFNQACSEYAVGPVASPNHVGEIQQKLALSEQVISTITQELCVQIENARLQEEALDSRLVSHELEIARDIQQSLLPKSFPSLPGYGLGGFCLSARQVGGDFYDVLPLAKDLVLLVVADVMGKGVPAALFAATLRTLLRTTAEWTQYPSELLARMNRLMFEELSSVDMFITAQLVLVDTRHKRLTVANAGHCPLLLADRLGETMAVSPDGMPLGIVPEIKFVDEIVPLDPFHCALLYTDGLTEARNAEGECFGQERLVKWLSESATRNHSAQQLSATFLQMINSFQSTTSLKDDQTFLMLAQETSVTPPPL
jgi:serine phosphatase RsbU (regulator of sigma subunit)/anti-sigma regulatory factor (Ser/Thr protein kinase)